MVRMYALTFILLSFTVVILVKKFFLRSVSCTNIYIYISSFRLLAFSAYLYTYIIIYNSLDFTASQNKNSKKSQTKARFKYQFYLNNSSNVSSRRVFLL